MRSAAAMARRASGLAAARATRCMASVETTIKISQDAFDEGAGGAVLLARGDVFADAFAGTPLAIDDAVAERGFEVVRLHGPTREETAIEAAEALVQPDPLLVTTGFASPTRSRRGRRQRTTGARCGSRGDRGGRVDAVSTCTFLVNPPTTRPPGERESRRGRLTPGLPMGLHQPATWGQGRCGSSRLISDTTRSTTSSRPAAAVTWIPTGTPVPSRPTGTEQEGNNVRFCGTV